MRTLKLTARIFSTLLALSAVMMLLNRILVTVNAGSYADKDMLVLVGCLGFTAYSMATTITLIQDKPE